MRADLRYLFASVAATAAFTFLALAFPNMTRSFTIPGALACFVLTVYFIWPEIRDFHKNRRKRVIALIGMIICALGLAGFAALYFWPQQSEIVAEGSPLDGAIQITGDPSQYPTVLPQNKIFELQLNNRFTTEGGAFLGWSLPAGSPLPSRDPSIAPSNGVRLRVSNYGKLASINMRVAFPVDFRAVIRTQTGTSSGDIVKSTTLTTNPFSIGPGELVDIYAMNYSTDAFATVVIPQTAQGFAPGSDKQETFKLIPPFLGGMSMPPFVPKSPPAPSPPNKQGKK
jgi:hypothetical protein